MLLRTLILGIVSLKKHLVSFNSLNLCTLFGVFQAYTRDKSQECCSWAWVILKMLCQSEHKKVRYIGFLIWAIWAFRWNQAVHRNPSEASSRRPEISLGCWLEICCSVWSQVSKPLVGKVSWPSNSPCYSSGVGLSSPGMMSCYNGSACRWAHGTLG